MRKLAYILIFIFAICNLYTQQEIDTLAQKNQAGEKLVIKNPEGEEFWLCFMQNYKSDDNDRNPNNALMLELFITSEKDAEVTISIKSLNYIKKNKSTSVNCTKCKNITISRNNQQRNN